MRSLLGLLISSLFLWTLIIFLSIYPPTLTGAHPDTIAVNFLPYLPGISIAMLSGVAGALFNGMLDIYSRVSARDSKESSSDRDLVYYVIIPFLGAMAGMILFFFFAAGGLSLTSHIDLSSKGGKNLGALIYDELTPGSAGQLATVVTLTFVGGYFFRLVPDLFDVIWKKRLENKPRPKKSETV